MNRPMVLISKPFWDGAAVLRDKLAGRSTLGILLALILLLLIGWLYLDQTAALTQARAEIRALQLERAEIAREYRAVQAALARQQSIERLMHVAPQLGFAPPVQMNTVNVRPWTLPVERAGAEPLAGQFTGAGGEQTSASPAWLLLVSQVSEWVSGSR